MKKFKLIILSIISVFAFVGTVNASTANVNVSATASQVIIGNTVTVYVTISSASSLGTWEYGLNYDSNVFRLVTTSPSLHVVDYFKNDATKTVSYAYTFTAIAKGTGTFSLGSVAVTDLDEHYMTLNTSSATVSTITYNEYQDSLSKNNNLATLKVDGADLEPEFNKDTLEYNVKVSEDTKEINISATAEDNTATVSGIGPQQVSPGNNTFEIYVVAQNGSEKVYKVNVEVVDKNPIKVKNEDDEYTVVKIRDNLTAPKGFKESKTTIDGFEIPSYYSDIMKITVVGLKDEKGKIVMFTYENGKYEKYLELNLGNITIRPIAMKTTMEGYDKATIKVNNIEVECLQKTKEDRYKYIYGINVETNEEGLFTIDTKDNTIMKFDKEESNEITNQTKILFITSCSFAGTTFVSLIIIISLLASKNKKKEKKKAPVKEAKNKNNICPKCHQEYDAKEKECPYCALKDEITKEQEKMSDTEKVKQNFTPGKEEKVENAAEADDDEIYDIFEDDRKRKKKKKKEKKK